MNFTPEIEFRPFPAYLGEKVRGRLSQTVRETSKINSVTIDLVCTKSTIHSNNEGGTSVETEELQRWSKQLDVSAMVEPPEKLSSVFSFDIPPNAPESTRGHKQVAIGWEVQLHTDIADCPDYHASFPLIIDRRIIVPGE